MSPLVILMKVLALSAALVVVASAHYIEISNDCPSIKFTGTVGDARWRGSTKPLKVGRFDTLGDTSAHLTTNFGTVSVNLFVDASTMNVKLDPTAAGAPKNAMFKGTLGFDIKGEHPHPGAECSAQNDYDCKTDVPLLNGAHWPAYAKFEFSCPSGAAKRDDMAEARDGAKKQD